MVDDLKLCFLDGIVAGGGSEDVAVLYLKSGVIAVERGVEGGLHEAVVILPIHESVKSDLGGVGEVKSVLSDGRLLGDGVFAPDDHGGCARGDDFTAEQLGMIGKFALKVGVDIPVIPCGGDILGDKQCIERIAVAPELALHPLIIE